MPDLDIFEIDLEALQALPEPERREIESQLESFKTLLDRNPLWKYRPHARQVEFHEAQAKTRAFIGGNQSGKTTAGIADNLINTVDVEFLPPWLVPYKRWPDEFLCRVVVVDLVQALEGVMLPKIKAMAPKDALWKGDWTKAWNARRRRLQFANGNWWEFLTHDMDVDQHAGGTLHRVHFDEEPPGNKGKLIKEESDMRLLHFDGDMLFTMTPLLGLSWAFHELTRRGEPRRDQDVHAVTVHMDENPHLSDRAKKRLMKGYSAETRAARVEGRFIHFAGRIYPQFDKDSHVIPAVELPRDRKGRSLAEVYVGIDPGVDHPTGLVWVTHDHMDRFEVIRSMKVPGATTGQIAGLIQATNAELRVEPRWYVIDPSARNRSQQTGKSLQMNFLDHGIVTIPGNNDRRSGFDRIRELLEGDRLLLHAGNDALEDEFESYRWKPAPNVEALGKEEPIKVNDDILDALRYVVMSRTLAGEEEEPEEPFVPEAARAFRAQLAKLGRRGSRGGGHHPLGDIYT